MGGGRKERRVGRKKAREKRNHYQENPIQHYVKSNYINTVGIKMAGLGLPALPDCSLVPFELSTSFGGRAKKPW